MNIALWVYSFQLKEQPFHFQLKNVKGNCRHYDIYSEKALQFWQYYFKDNMKTII